MGSSEHAENRKRKPIKFPERDDDPLALKLSSYCPPIIPKNPPPAEHIFMPSSLPSSIALPSTPVEQRFSPSISTQALTMQTLLSQAPPQIPLQFPPTHSLYTSSPFVPGSPPPPPVAPNPPSRPVRTRRNPSHGAREGRSETVPVPFPWATDRRATVRDLNYLLQRQMLTITGKVQCKRCEREYEMGFDLKSKFAQVENFIAENKSTMHDRAPTVWMNPILPTCRYCHQDNSLKPIIAEEKKSINWLFLLLGQMLGCCTLEQLKYFCKHTKNHRTGAKDRVLYLTYLELCKRLEPKDLFER